ncbi:MAG: cyclic peptide export ABC transporter, partial [Archangium sp.]
ISERVRGAELPHFEQLGSAPIYTSLADDTRVLSESANVLVGALSSSLLIILAMLYVAVLSFPAFLMISTLLVLGIGAYVYGARNTRSVLHRAAAEEQRFFTELGHLLHGFKELKIDAEKSEALFEQELKVVAHRAQDIRLQAARQFSRVIVFGESFFYGLMGLLIFVLPAFSEQEDSSSTLVKVIAVLMFITNAVGVVVNAFPAAEKASIAIERLEQLEARLGPVAVPPAPQSVEAPAFERLSCEGLTFRYPEVGGRSAFQLGPINLEVRRGEIVFIIGGNGSGKSTFLKLLCGLYPPSTGHLTLNGEPIIPGTLQHYRSKFAIILQDFHLFSRLFHVRRFDRARVQQLLTAFDLASVTGIREDGLLENTQLSKGQQKRLALLVTDLEDRDVLIFDEWAADQDPEFRSYFYKELIGSLAARGKTVIAATHDDHYFHLADRVFKMTEGKLEPYAEHPRMSPV